MDKLEQLRNKVRALHPEWNDQQVEDEAQSQAQQPEALGRLSSQAAKDIFFSTPKVTKQPTTTEPQPGIPSDLSANKATPEELEALKKKLPTAAPAQPATEPPTQKQPPPPSARAAGPTTPPPSDTDEKKFRSQIEALTKSTDDKEVNQRAKALEAQYRTALLRYKQDQDTLGWGRVAEMMGRAMVQLAAGAYGAKHNIDLSNLKGEKWDWKQDFDNLNNGIDLELKGIDKQLSLNEKAQENIDKRNEKARDIKAGAEETIYKEKSKSKSEAARDAKAQRAEDERLAREQRARDAKLDEKTLDDVQALLKNKSPDQLKNEDSLRAWASATFGASAAEDIVSKAKSGEWWGIDSDKAKRAISDYAARVQQRRDSRIGEAPSTYPQDIVTDSSGKRWKYKGSGDRKDKANYTPVE